MASIGPKDTVDKSDFKLFRNYIIEQQAIFIVLLNKIGDIKLSKPVKKSFLTQQRIKVETITIGLETISISTVVETRCAERLQLDINNGVARKTAIRRQTFNKIMENHHLLCDLLFEFGYLFESQYSSGKNQTPKIEIVNKIFADGKVLFTKDDISKKGSEINTYLTKKLLKDDVLILKRNDKQLQLLIQEGT